MKLRFIATPLGREEYKVGDVVDFSGFIAEGYARKYIDRGWAELHVEPKPEPKPEPVKPIQQRPVLTAKPKTEESEKE